MTVFNVNTSTYATVDGFIEYYKFNFGKKIIDRGGDFICFSFNLWKKDNEINKTSSEVLMEIGSNVSFIFPENLFKKYEGLYKNIKEKFDIRFNCFGDNRCCLFSDKHFFDIWIQRDNLRIECCYDNKESSTFNKEDLFLDGEYSDKKFVSDDAINFSSVYQDRILENKEFNLSAPFFKTIEDNYSSEIVESTNKLVDLVKSQRFVGKIIVLQGDPGSGKSYWIKSFMREIKESNFHPVIVLEADKFFSSIATYYEVLDKFAEDRKNLVFIFEDSGRFFDRNAQMEKGNMVSVMLNITDGLISSGRRDLFLFSFNQDLGTLDKALIRDGRCLGRLKFGLFDKNKARDWLVVKSKELGIEYEFESGLKDNMSLAELYMLLLSSSKVEAELESTNKLGF